MRLSLDPEPRETTPILWIAAALSGAFAVLLALAFSWVLVAEYLVAALVLAFGAWKTRPDSVIGRWTVGDILLVFAGFEVAQAYSGIFELFGKSPIAGALDVVVAYGATAFGVFVVIVKRRGSRPSGFGVRRPNSAIWFLVIPLFLAAAYLSSTWLQSWQSHLQAFHSVPNTQCTDVKQTLQPNILGYALGFPGVVVAAAIVEEIMFRGLLYGWLVSFVKRSTALTPLASRLGIAGAILLSGVIFGAFHATAFGILPVLPLSAVGVVLTLLYELSGSLFPGMITHAAFNAVGLYVLLLTRSPC